VPARVAGISMVVGKFKKLTHWQYQRLAIRLRGAPAKRDFRVVGMESRAQARTSVLGEQSE